MTNLDNTNHKKRPDTHKSGRRNLSSERRNNNKVKSHISQDEFLPVSAIDMLKRGWDAVDFVYVIGDAYVDHPSFGPAIISRLLEAKGFKVGIISQPDWNNVSSIETFGTPRLGFIVSAGNMDSLVNHYTVAKKRRRKDAYSPGGQIGLRPDRATIVYCNLIRRAFKHSPIIIGGIEASLRRLAHYDYWSDSLRRSILLDSGADLLSYGMGERSIVEIADSLQAGIPIEDITFVNGTVWRTKTLEHVYDAIELPTYESMVSSKLEYARSFAIQYKNSDPFSASRMYEAYERQGFVVQNPPAEPLSTEELDAIYELPFTGCPHPMYDKLGGVPAISEVAFSITSSRGCFGECSFCALTFHQGRIVVGRSKESLVAEAKRLTKRPDFKGNINDVGGPTANFMHPACDKQAKDGSCTNRRCLSPTPCPNLNSSHKDYLDVLRELRKLDGVKRVFVRSGIRYDYILEDKQFGQEFLDELVAHHVSGQLRVAPEHVNDCVLNLMGKPSIDKYNLFVQMFDKATKRAGKEQYVLPYLMSSHPGSDMSAAEELGAFVDRLGFRPEQVQDFYPTPSTRSTVMYFTGVDPLTMKTVYVPKSPTEKAKQRALIDPQNKRSIH